MTERHEKHWLLTKETSVSVGLVVLIIGGYGWLISQLDGIGTRLAVIESSSEIRYASQDRRLDKVERAISEIPAELAGIKLEIGILKTEVAALKKEG